jgi:hypothetical protein
VCCACIFEKYLGTVPNECLKDMVEIVLEYKLKSDETV